MTFDEDYHSYDLPFAQEKIEQRDRSLSSLATGASHAVRNAQQDKNLHNSKAIDDGWNRSSPASY
jgi:hypothetical protein